MSYGPPPAPLTLAEEVELLRATVGELEELAEFWEKRSRVAEESGYYEGYLVGRASKIKDSSRWGADGVTFTGLS